MSNTKGTSAIVAPSGGGAQSGLGEKFSPDLFTGTGNFSVPIAVPSGRNGMQPNLSLGYSTGNGNGVFGMGWALGIPGIMRKTSKGIPVYDDRKDVFILSGAEDLVPVKQEKETIEENGTSVNWERTFYRPRTEGLFARIVHHKKSNGRNYWEVRSKDGLVTYYGSPDITFNETSFVIANPENRNAIFGWTLSKTVDPFGNEVIYEYERELVLSDSKFQPHSSDQLYLSSIKYNQYYEENVKKHLCEVRFEYEERADSFSAYRQGFEIRTTKRCKAISTYTHADETRKVKTYHFNYLEELPLNGVSLLRDVSVEGHKGEESEWMPPLEFGYSTFKPSIRGLDEIKSPIPSLSLAQPGYELVDVTGNGLPDLLQMDGTGSRYWPNKGKGVFASPKTIPVSPSIQLGNAGVQLIDANGDGRSDLLVVNGLQAGYFSGSFNDVWDKKNYRSYSKKPSFSLVDPEVQFMDLDGDGITDVLRNGAKFECFLNDPEKGFDQIRIADKTFADFSFSDPRIRFADMTGDGLQDIVLISSGRVQYWPNLGYGRFGQVVNMKNAPRFPEQFNPKQILLGDLDGDGQADIAFVENNRVTLYVNQSGNGFSEEVIIMGTPAVHQVESLRIADIMGTGQSGIVWSQIVTTGTKGRMFFLDFTGGNKPYLLEEMNNNMGSVTRVEYSSSIEHFLRDDQDPLTRWKTQLPFPVQVVNRTEVHDLLSGGKLVTEYSYHNGYWDGAEREFRGFAHVDSRDTESFERFTAASSDGTENNLNNPGNLTAEYYSPPVETKSWFHLGPVGPDYTRWEELDFSYQYWQVDTNVLQRTVETKNLLSSLPRKARRDAIRTLRGTLLRSELYGRDGSALENVPYTIIESLMGIRTEFDPTQQSGEMFVFFSFSLAGRTSQYERGNDPMHQFTFTKDYDAYGNPGGQLSAGLPRGATPLGGGNGDYLGTYGISEFIYKDIPNGQYMVDRVKKSTSYDATKPASNLNIFGYKDLVFNSNILPVIGCSLNFYDGEAFEGLPYGQIGNYGLPVRSEALVLTDEIIESAYGSEIPECFKDTPDWSSSNGYPAAFEGLLQNGDERLGYKDRRTGFPNHEEGWYAESGRAKYDWQDSSIEYPVGLAIESRDVFDNRSTIDYDSYKFLPVSTKQWFNTTDYLENKAEYDYRSFQVNNLIDINDNISVFDFSPLGLLKATALIGKGTEGDYKSNSGGFYQRYAPSMKMEYDFFAFKNKGNPIWVKTILREEHYQDNPDSPTIVKVEYTDGFGRLLQIRSQAEDVIFGNQTFGTSGLPEDQSAANTTTIGIERDENDPINVVVSGWCIYNNKGLTVEQYEPFFDKGFDYSLPQLSTVGGIINPQLGMKVKIYYDTMGRVFCTVNPDESEQRVVFGIPTALNSPDNFLPSPWENYSYDANDLAPITNPVNNLVPVSHWYTPKSSLIDGLGRTIQTTEHKAHHNRETDTYEDVLMHYLYDIRGNLLQVRDSYNRKVFEHIYDLRPTQEDNPLPSLWTKHIDSGKSVSVFDAIGKIIKGKDAKEAQILSAYDPLYRPIYGWSKNNGTSPFRLNAQMIYGEQATTPKTNNFLGQVWQQYDESGKIESIAFDFKGNLLSKKQKVISSVILKTALDNYETYLVDWTGLPTILDTKIFETSNTFDALNRIIKITLPENVNNERKNIIPTYNRAGTLEKVSYDGTEYVENIAYNAKGERLLIAFGNDIMTRYSYDQTTFRLSRQRSEKYVKSHIGNTITYEPQSGSNKQDNSFNFDLVGNILKILQRVNDCGITGSILGNHALDRNFEYDPLYRVISADGRESDAEHENDYLYSDAPAPGTPNANNVRAYTRNYYYDKLGNIQQVKQLGTNGFTRNFMYNTEHNTLKKVETPTHSLIEDFTYDTCGNLLTAGTTRNYVWNAGNQLITYYNQAGSADPTIFTQYDYSGMNRVSKLVRTGTSANPIYERTIYIDGLFECCILENGTIYEKNYIHIMDDTSRIAMIRIGDLFPDDISADIVYNLEDQIGSSTIRLDGYGTTIDKEEYYPFGDSSLRTFTKKRYRYVGKEKDLESGLYYYGARYYVAWTCRFISVDPLSSKYAQLSPYNYSDNNPINDYDIDGLQNNNSKNSEQGKNGGETVIQSTPMEGQRNFTDKNADRNEVLKLPTDGMKENNIVEFIYTNKDNSKLVSRYHFRNGDKWEKDVSGTSASGRFGHYYMGTYITMNEIALLKKDLDIKKAENHEIKKIQAGDEKEEESKIEKVETTKIIHKKVIKTSSPPITSSKKIPADFAPGKSHLTKKSTKSATNALREIARALKKNPNATFTIIANTEVGVGGSWSTITRFKVSAKALATNRMNTITDILISMGVDRSQIIRQLGSPNGGMNMQGTLFVPGTN
ncbi:SpvB/TcaC N-terminal domain-containing protein [uncultured Fluviicola sp.]|uniref:SpvB/TcaC N-terminal domain-containing protein n=1 Tax=uncultured Fluviicola sp. TaxID=463303 RepID=UPI0025EDF6D5|nr:SpvB/TcaC N-terminal domain-containing protein [uncultured Fluviicola sp.]